MHTVAPTGNEVIQALKRRYPAYTTARARGDNDKGVSIRHPDVPSSPRDRLVCHIHVDEITDVVTGFYFAGRKDDRVGAERTAGSLLPKMDWKLDPKRGGIEDSGYPTANFIATVTLDEILLLVERARTDHPARSV